MTEPSRFADTGSGCVNTRRDAVKPTTLIQSSALSDRLGVNITLASETFQHTGSFKFRAAFNVVSKSEAGKFIAASSGNFGQALAYACQLLNRQCVVVMPSNSARVKVDAVLRYGAMVELVDVAKKSRAKRVDELSAENPDAQIVSAYDHELVIEGNASLGDEIAQFSSSFEDVIVPIGGGGLASGIITGLRRSHCHSKVFGAEPLLANDAARSLRAGMIIKNEAEPQSIADGARTLSLGTTNWPILKAGLEGIVEVPEELIEEAVRLLFGLVNLKVEPTGALSVAALLAEPELFKNKSVCCVISGGNVDPSVYSRIIATI
jgi:threonine dehydratase